MPPRVVRSEINASRSLARVSLMADLAFRALIVSVDDYGRCEADPLMLKAELFPRRPQVTPKMIEGWVAELVEEGCVQRYEVDGVEYLQLTGWEKHRSNSKRASCSRFPDPPAFPRAIPESPGDPGRPRGSARLTSDDWRLTSDECRERPGESAADAAAPAGSAPPKKAKRKAPETPPPERLEPRQLEALRLWALEHEEPDVRAQADRVPQLAAACLDWARSNQKTSADWIARVRNWVRKDVDIARERSRAGPARVVPLRGSRPLASNSSWAAYPRTETAS